MKKPTSLPLNLAYKTTSKPRLGKAFFKDIFQFFFSRSGVTAQVVSSTNKILIFYVYLKENNYKAQTDKKY